MRTDSVELTPEQLAAMSFSMAVVSLVIGVVFLGVGLGAIAGMFAGGALSFGAGGVAILAGWIP